MSEEDINIERSRSRNDHPAEHAERLLNFLASSTVQGVSAVERATISGLLGAHGKPIDFGKNVRVLIVYLEEEA